MKVVLQSLLLVVNALVLISCAGKPTDEPIKVPHEVGIAYMNLETGEILAYNAQTMFHAASTMKTPVMFQLFRMRDKGEISLSSTIPVINRFTSIADGSTFSLPITSETDEIIFPSIGGYLSFLELTEKMITASSNLATNILLEYSKPDSISKTLMEIGANGVMVVRGVEDLNAYRIGLNNTTSAYGMMKVMEAVYQSDLVADSSRVEMMEILKRQKYNSMIPAGLPDKVEVAHKTGSITRIAHDAAIVFPPSEPPFVLVILTRGWDDHSEAQRVGAKITEKVYDYHRGFLKRTDIVVPDLLK